MSSLSPRYATYPSTVSYSPARLPQPSQDLQQLLADEKELKKERLWAAGWGGVDGVLAYLGTLLLKNPEKSAANRPEVLSGQRSLADAQAFEKQKKKATLRAQLPHLLVSLPIYAYGLVVGGLKGWQEAKGIVKPLPIPEPVQKFMGSRLNTFVVPIGLAGIHIAAIALLDNPKKEVAKKHPGVSV